MINRRLTTSEAATRLGVKPATLYAYVSRGVLGSERGPSGSTFDAQEVERLAIRGRRGHEGSRQLAFASGLTLIEGRRLYYRGEDAVALAGSRSFEEVASWLWTGAFESWPTRAETVSAAVAAQAALPDTSLPLDRLKVMVPVIATTDPLRIDTASPSVVTVGRRLLAAMVEGLPAVPNPGKGPHIGDVSRESNSSERLAVRLWSRLTAIPATPARVDALNAALVLLADHELAASTLAVRVAAAFRADPYAVVGTGLGAVSGTWHGGSSLAVEAFLHQALASDPAQAIGSRLRSGELVPGFGQPLYPSGDPRATALLSRLPALELPADRLAVIDGVLSVAGERGYPAPNVDFGLGALSMAADMIPGAGEAIFAIGRTAGWIAHAIEEYASPGTFRARATYVGPRPDALG
jgi:citrate synthase